MGADDGLKDLHESRFPAPGSSADDEETLGRIAAQETEASVALQKTDVLFRQGRAEQVVKKPGTCCARVVTDFRPVTGEIVGAELVERRWILIQVDDAIADMDDGLPTQESVRLLRHALQKPENLAHE